jgi:hypothetical protein
MPRYIFLLLSILCVACGNGSRDLTAKKLTANAVSAGGVSTASSIFVDGGNQFSSCVSLQVYSGLDASSVAMLSGMSACPSISSSTLVKIKPSSNLPTNERICFIPANDSQTGNATCTSINGDSNLNLQLANFKYLTIVRENQLSNYWAWDGYSDYYPTMAFAQLR